MKYLLLFLILLLTISACSNKQEINYKEVDCNIYADGVKFEEDCNICVCYGGEKTCTQNDCDKQKDILPEKIKNTSNNNVSKTNDSFIYKKVIDFNANLTEYELKYLNYLEEKYPQSQIYYLKSNLINCNQCYEIYYKKDRTIIKIKIIDNKITQETEIKKDLSLEIETKEICEYLFFGTWNSCPKICPTDEETCLNECAPPKCEFEDEKNIIKSIGDKCGGLDEGDCMYGLTCYHENENTTYGTCVKWDRGKILYE